MLRSTLDPQKDHSKRDGTHTSDIKNEKSKGTKYSKYIWKLKTNSKSYELRWEIMHKNRELKNVDKTCKTCNLEKIEITLAYKE